MKINNSKIKKLIVGASLSVGILVGAFGVLPVAAKGIDQGTTPNYPMNENGETYGSDAHAASFEEVPDLIAVRQNEIFGYVRREDLYQEEINMPSSPNDKAGWEEYEECYANGYQIPIYDVDGETVIGTFSISSENDNAEEDESYDSVEDAVAATLKEDD